MNRAAGDALRTDILQALQQDSFAVLELSDILNVPQPALSHHLKILLNAGLVAQRREGNNIFYRRALIAPNNPLARLMRGIFGNLDELPMAAELQRGIEAVHRKRSTISRNYFTTHAREFRSHQARIGSAGVYASVVLDMLMASNCGRQRVLEVGPGSGELMTCLIGKFDSVCAIDNAEAMLEQTRTELQTQGIDTVDFILSDFNDLEIDTPVDAIVAGMVLHHLPSPAYFFRQAARLMHPQGVLVVAELCQHDQNWVRQACGDLWLGFPPEELDELAISAGFRSGQSQYLAQKNGFRIQVRCYTKAAER